MRRELALRWWRDPAAAHGQQLHQARAPSSCIQPKLSHKHPPPLLYPSHHLFSSWEALAYYKALWCNISNKVLCWILRPTWIVQKVMVRKSKKASFANLTFHRILGGDGEAKLNLTQLINWTAQYCVLCCIFTPALCFDNHISKYTYIVQFNVWHYMSGLTFQ